MQPVWSSSRALPCAWNRFGIELERAAAYSGPVMIERTTHRQTRPSLAVDLLVIYAAAATLAAWTCSWLGWLASPGLLWGVLLAFALALSFVLYWREGAPTLRLPRFRRHGRRVLPLLYTTTFALLLLSVILHPSPSNYDHLTYRFPRLLHWWAQGGWFWIEGADPRLNYSGAGFEWIWYPLFLAWRSDVGAALLNLLGFALMPGLVFRVYTGFGLSPRMAASWMWVLPSAYCFVLQAGGAGNDLIGAVFALIAFASLLEGWRERRFRATGVGALAAALLSGIKLSNVPLLLPLGLLLVSRRNLQSVFRVRFIPVLLVCAVVSFIPVAAINLKMTGDYAGDPGNRSRIKAGSPLAGVAGNLLQAGVASLSPPVNPVAGPWNAFCESRSSGPFLQWMHRQYPRFSLRLREIAGEEDGGLGIGITAFLFLSLVSIRRRPGARGAALKTMRFWSMTGVLAAWVVFLMNLGSECSPRIAAPYYALLLALPFLVLRAERWRYPGVIKAAGALCVILSWSALLLTPSRPLVPWRELVARLPGNTPMAERMRDVYTLYAQRHDAFRPLKEAAGGWAGIRHVGVAGLSDDPEASLWKPFEGQVVHYLLPGMPPSAYPAMDVVLGRRTVVGALLETAGWKEWSGACRRTDVRLALKARTGPEDWVVLVRPIHEN
jgi:hypothetical protein